jgi:isopentenyl diphosphate isomerase/L-lactate dehydrogenase-like FMN-dependent dehydrogenase
VISAVDQFDLELRTAMFCSGAGSVSALREPGRIERVSV